MSDKTPDLRRLTADIVSAFVANNSIGVDDLSSSISNVYASLSGLGSAPIPDTPKQQPAVPIRLSIKPDYLVCLEDGRKLKMLRRHLIVSYGLTADAYRTKWGLSSDYPMVAPNYSKRRRSLALQLGLGTKAPPAPVAAPADVPSDTRSADTASMPKPRGRQSIRPVADEA